MKKTITVLFLILTMLFSLTACGGNANSNASADSGSTDSTPSSQTSEPQGELPPEFLVMIYWGNSADFHIATQKTAACSFYQIEFDDYVLVAEKMDNNELACTLYKQNGMERTYIGDCEYLANEYETIISVPTVVLGIEGFSFNAVSQYTLYDGDETTTYSAAEVAVNDDGTPADIVKESQSKPADEPSDTVPADYANITFVSDDGYKLIITETDAQGYPVSMSFNGNEIVFDSVSCCSDDGDMITALLKWSTENGNTQSEFFYFRSTNSIILKGYAVGEYYPEN